MDLPINHALSRLNPRGFITEGKKENSALVLIGKLGKELLLQQDEENMEWVYAIKLLADMVKNPENDPLKRLSEKVLWNFISDYTDRFQQNRLDDRWIDSKTSALQVMSWGLMNKLIYKPATKLDALVWFFKSDFNADKNSPIISSLSRQGLSPLFPFFWGEKRGKEISWINQQEVGYLYEMHEFIYDLTFESKALEFEKIKKKSAELSTLPCHSFFKGKINEFQKKWDVLSKSVSNLKKISDVSQQEIHELQVCALMTNNGHGLIQLERISNQFTEEMVKSNLIVNFMMDKVLSKLTINYRGASTAGAAYTFVESLAATANKKDKRLRVETALFQLLAKRLKKLTKLYPVYLALSVDSFAKKIREDISAMQVGGELLVPAGSEGHAVCMLITKKKNGFQLNLYNTGSGVQLWHPNWKNSSKYQTFLIIDQISEKEILSENFWKQVAEINKTGQINSLYILIQGLQGQIKPAETEIEFYEDKQSSMTCGAQSFMALFRHLAMSSIEGAPAEKKAFYNFVKTKTFLTLYLENEKKLPPTIKKDIQTVIAKLTAEMGLIETALSAEGDSFLHAYALLRKQAEEQEHLKNDVLLEWRVAKEAHKHAIQKNIEACLNEISLQDKEKMALIFYRILTSTQFSELAIPKIVELLGETKGPFDSSGIERLLECLSKAPLRNNFFVQKIISAFLKAGQDGVADYVQKSWNAFIFFD